MNFAALIRAIAQRRQHQHPRDALRSSRSTTRRPRSRWRRKCRSSPASSPTPARRQGAGQPVPDHPARGSRHHPQDHAADQRRRLGACSRSSRKPRASRRARTQVADRPHHEQAHHHHQRAGRGRRHRRARRPDQGQVRESEQRVPFLGSIPIIGELFKTRSGDKVKTQPDGLHPPAILRDGVAGGDRDQREVQLHARPAARPQQGQGAADAGRAAADAARRSSTVPPGS